MYSLVGVLPSLMPSFPVCSLVGVLPSLMLRVNPSTTTLGSLSCVSLHRCPGLPALFPAPSSAPSVLHLQA